MKIIGFDDPLHKAMQYAIAFELGIIPVDDSDQKLDAAFAQFPPDEARRMKRKFRKIWRREVKKIAKIIGKRRGQRYLDSYMSKGGKPSKWQLAARRSVVYTDIMDKADAAVKGVQKKT